MVILLILMDPLPLSHLIKKKELTSQTDNNGRINIVEIWFR